MSASKPTSRGERQCVDHLRQSTRQCVRRDSQETLLAGAAARIDNPLQ